MKKCVFLFKLVQEILVTKGCSYYIGMIRGRVQMCCFLNSGVQLRRTPTNVDYLLEIISSAVKVRYLLLN